MVTLTKGGIAVTVADTNVVASGYFWDGQPWVQVSGYGSLVSVTGWTPTYIPSLGAPSGVRNGAVKNRRGNLSAQGYDGRFNYTASQSAVVPVVMTANDTLTIAKSGAGGSVTRVAYFPVPGRSNVDEMIVLTVVDYAPTATEFRPNAVGNPVSRQRRLFADVNWSMLPTKLNSAHAQVPALADCLLHFSGFCGEVIDGWSTDQTTPNFQHPGYGQWLNSAVSEALLRVCSDDAIALRQPLARALIQWAIDLWGAFRDGRAHDANGGHGQGRKALVLFGGRMLGDADMSDPDTSLGVESFNEHYMYYEDGTDTWWGPSWKWRKDSTAAAASAYQNTAPSGWSLGGQDTVQFFESYHDQETVQSHLGQAWAMGLMGSISEWGIEAYAVSFLHMMFYPAAWDAAVPAALNYRSTALGTGWSHRGGSNGVWQTDAFLFVVDFLMSRGVTWLEAWTPDSDTLVAVTFDEPVYDVPFKVEIFNGPQSVVTSCAVWVGPALAASHTNNGFPQWNHDDAGAAVAGLPNVYGYHTFNLTIATPTVPVDQTWAVNVVYTMDDASFKVCVPLAIELTV